ncbi:hypothetical protein [Marivirga harenae]|uniref:hypothetical protein n=1 Tax=Marivirga harenae TaxID=2010992 RepID=UPI0026DFB22C|nr:hypothetical protein [Marivirga harenae]WKV10741.1 hypothetical protein Q3Y49_11005 [Marivirga harenae]
MKKLKSAIPVAYLRILVFFLFALFVMSCDNQSPVDEGPPDHEDVSALIVFDGSPAVDGCGWLIQIDQEFQAPVNLDSAFMIESLEVVLSYNFLESNRLCGWRDPGYKEIEILEIKKQ